MPVLPAFCRTCGTMFPGPVGGENVADVTVTNITVGPCPNCGGTGEVPDGTYDFKDQAIQLVTGPDASRAKMQRYYEVLRFIHHARLDENQARDVIRKEAPDLEPVVMSVKEQRRWKAVTGVLIPLLIAYLGLLMTAEGAEPPSVSEAEAAFQQASVQAVNRY